MVYNVLELLDDLDGHEKVLDREIKIKLADGSIREIGGFEFVNIIVGGDDIIYIKELDEDWYKYKEELRLFIKYGYQIAQGCNVIIRNRYYENTDFALESIVNVAREADYWLNKLNIKHDYDPLTGEDNEIFGKIDLLRKWYNKHIKRDIDKL